MENDIEKFLALVRLGKMTLGKGVRPYEWENTLKDRIKFYYQKIQTYNEVKIENVPYMPGETQPVVCIIKNSKKITYTIDNVQLETDRILNFEIKQLEKY